MDLHGLREVIDLGARAEADKIPRTDIERQERTVLRAHDLLEHQPGVVLADEVGMGKTFEALGVAALIQDAKPRAKIVVITPGPDLNTKWTKEIGHFEAIRDFGSSASVRRLGPFIEAVREHNVTIAPMTMFQSGRGAQSQAWLLSMYFRWAKLHGHTANAILARYRDGELGRVNVDHEGFLRRFPASDFRSGALQRAFRRGTSGGGYRGLHDIYEDEGLAGFVGHQAVYRALHRARTILVGSLLPILDLLIVDEAHKLKSAGSQRTQGLRRVMARRYRKALFLTATPFQLDVSELGEVFHLFGQAHKAPADLDEQIAGLLEAIGDYQRSYTDFQRDWGRLDFGQAAEFRAHYTEDPKLRLEFDDPSLERVADELRALIWLKEERIEPGLRRWMIRSLRKGKREYRDNRPESLAPGDGAALPFLIYERFIAELFRNPHERGTHKAAAEINMVSSFQAARAGALLGESSRSFGPEAQAYRRLLRAVLEGIGDVEAGHAKLSFSLEDALEAATAEDGEKTLVFCTRVATLSALKQGLDRAWFDHLLERWRGVFPGASQEAIFAETGRHRAIQKRLHAHSDALYLALRERYLHTVLPIAPWAREQVDTLLERANATLRGLRVLKTAAERRDYKLAKRCVEHAAALYWRAQGEPSEVLTGRANPDAVAALCDPQFVSLGLDLVADELEKDADGNHQPSWTIDRELALDVIGDGRSLWVPAAGLLERLDRGLRVELTERLARYLGFQQVPFVADLLTAAHGAGLGVDPLESRPLLAFIDGWWAEGPGARWRARLLDFLRFFVDRDEQHREIIVDEVLRKRSVAFARHTKDAAGRERLREAFNTPLFPMVLVANEVMQEGLDLHRSCRRVIHHDLAWNPAQLEQRVGRVDRLGSRLFRLRETDSAAKLDVLFPMIRGTIDERLYQVVRRREKWLEFLLGAPPDLDEYRLDDEEPPALPEGLAERLKVELGPERVGE